MKKLKLVARWCFLGALVLNACAAMGGALEEQKLFQGKQVPPPNDRLQIQTRGNITVATAVPSAEETKKVFGHDLYSKNIQPVWVRLENRGEHKVILAPMGLDPAYFTPRETASRNRRSYTEPFSQQFEQRSLSKVITPANSIQSGYIFTRVDEGTKSFNIDIIGDNEIQMMTFFVPVPGLKLDHYEVDIAGMYSERELQHVTLSQLRDELESMPCCVRDKKGKDKGDPLNLVFIGNIEHIYYAFMRAGWDETETSYSASLIKMAASAVMGGRYRYSPVSALYVFNRSQDFAMQRARSSINKRNHLRVWLTTLRYEGKPVWIGQISRDIGVHFTWRTITTHKIDPDVDETREFLGEDLAYAQSVQGFSYVGGVGPAPYDKPRGNLSGDPYFTDGQRLVIWVAPQPTGIDEIKFIDLSATTDNLTQD